MLWTDVPARPVDVGVQAERIAGLPDDPLDVVAALAPLTGERRLVVLSGAWAGGATIITADPTRVFEAADPVAAARVMSQLTVVADATRDSTRPGIVGGGWLGLIGHAAGAGLDSWPVPPVPVDGPACPTAAFGWYDHVLRHDGHAWWVDGLDDAGMRAGRALAAEARRRCTDARYRAAEARASAADTRPDPGAGPLATDLTAPDAAAHMVAVEQAVTAIRTGQIVQTTICSRYKFHVKHPVLPWTALVRALQPQYAALVTGPWGALLGASPELYLRRVGRTVESAPIKGTAPADRDPRRLQGSTKDVAENLMIVDLVRNDLSRVAVPGTVRTPDLLTVRRQAGVDHLVSRVTARLRPDVHDAALIRATFPPGSVTGAPKLRATEISNRLESAGRGAHTGAVGFVSPVAGMELAVTIRSIEVGADGSAALGVGSGITVGSTPATEWEECVTKAAPILAALGLAPHSSDGRAPAPGPDPALGLIETVLVTDGRVVDLADHVDRLTRSFAELYGRPPTIDAAYEMTAAAPGHGTFRMRLRVRPDAAPDGRDTAVVDHLTPWPFPAAPATQPGLRAVIVTGRPGGGGRHKYADRSWWEAAEAAAAAYDAVVFTDADGHILESSRANVFAVMGGHLTTPAADGRILPGTARQQLVDEVVAAGGHVRLAPLHVDDLAAASGVMLVNALRAVQWVASVDTPAGRLTWPGADPVTIEAGRLLRTRWTGMRQTT